MEQGWNPPQFSNPISPQPNMISPFPSPAAEVELAGLKRRVFIFLLDSVTSTAR